VGKKEEVSNSLSRFRGRCERFFPGEAICGKSTGVKPTKWKGKKEPLRREKKGKNQGRAEAAGRERSLVELSAGGEERLQNGKGGRARRLKKNYFRGEGELHSSFHSRQPSGKVILEAKAWECSKRGGKGRKKK